MKSMSVLVLFAEIACFCLAISKCPQLSKMVYLFFWLLVLWQSYDASNMPVSQDSQVTILVQGTLTFLKLTRTSLRQELSDNASGQCNSQSQIYPMIHCNALWSVVLKATVNLISTLSTLNVICKLFLSNEFWCVETKSHIKFRHQRTRKKRQYLHYNRFCLLCLSTKPEGIK